MPNSHSHVLYKRILILVALVLPVVVAGIMVYMFTSFSPTPFFGSPAIPGKLDVGKISFSNPNASTFLITVASTYDNLSISKVIIQEDSSEAFTFSDLTTGLVAESVNPKVFQTAENMTIPINMQYNLISGKTYLVKIYSNAGTCILGYEVP
jgi:hypothetical protein